jgi:hypothetical protein
LEQAVLNSPLLQEALRDHNEFLCEVAEAAVHARVQREYRLADDDVKASAFWLRTQGKHRGWNTRPIQLPANRAPIKTRLFVAGGPSTALGRLTKEDIVTLLRAGNRAASEQTRHSANFTEIRCASATNVQSELGCE